MEPIVLRPEKALKTMWFIGWAIPFVLVLAFWVVLLLTGEVGKLGFGICLIGWLILMSLILFWIPAFYNSLEYVIESNSVKMRRGVFWRKGVTVPYTKITNIDVTQGPVQRMFDIGTIHVQTAGAGGPQAKAAEQKLLGIRDMDGLKNTIMERVRGYIISRPGEVKKEVVEGSDSEMFRHMLKELTTIRELLEKKQG